MSQKYLKMLLAALLVGASIPAFSQVAPGATGGGLPLTVGIAYSNYHTDWSGRLSGPMFWADWNFYNAPSLLHSFGIEVEARDLNYHRTGGDPKLRMDTVAGGAIYTWRHYHKLQPYTKFLVGFGSIDFSPIPGLSPNYTHDTRTVYAPGIGLDYLIYRGVWVRGNFEYQFWPHFINNNALDPYGFTIGASYDFNELRRRQ
jgi:hypothetical protein